MQAHRYYNEHRQYVDAIALHKQPEGDAYTPPDPLRFRTQNEDGTETVYKIATIHARDRMAARKAGGTGWRYVVDTIYEFEGLPIPAHFVLFYDNEMGDWFIEKE